MPEVRRAVLRMSSEWTRSDFDRSLSIILLSPPWSLLILTIKQCATPTIHVTFNDLASGSVFNDWRNNSRARILLLSSDIGFRITRVYGFAKIPNL